MAVLADPHAHEAFAAGRIAMARGDINHALKQYLKALLTAPDHSDYRRAVFETLGLLDGYKLPENVIAVLSACAGEDSTIDPTPLPRIARNVLMRDARWADLTKDTAADHAWFYDSPLLLAGLERATVTDEALEHVLTRMRRQFVSAVAREGSAPALTHHPRFVAALARQCVAVRHIWAEQSDERTALARILKDDKTPATFKPLLRCLYEPPSALTDEECAALPPVLMEIVKNRAQENELGAALPQLTAIDPGLSAAMKAQYETYPYPLWRDVAQNTPMSWPEMVAHFVGPTSAPIPTTATPEVLVAGCGTGRSTAMMAALLPSARILAVNLSRASLGYAARKAANLKISNVTFGVADILRLGELNQHFDLIECGGVLHHMAEHQRGLAVLANLLKPGGLLCLALYSERARGPIIATHAFVADHHFSDDVAGMRGARAAILALPADHPVRRISRRPDFYSADGLHDLVFNAYEVRFTPATLKVLIAAAGLSFLGFNVARADRMNAYRAAHPDDPLGRDLDRWEEFDKNYPDTFQGMFQMWLQKPT